MNRSPRSTSLLVFFAATLGAFGRQSRADEPAVERGPACGTVALFNLLRFSGRSGSLDEVTAALPGRDPRGHSLAELRDGANRLDLDLEGIQFLHADVTPDRPVIAFVERAGHGHFLAIRPVGHTGRLVQVLDGLADPEVMDMGDLVRQPGWTGLGLTIRGPRWTTFAAMLLAASAILLGLGGIRMVVRARRRGGQPIRIIGEGDQRNS